MDNLEVNKIDKHLKPVISGEEKTSLEVATDGNGAKVSGDLNVTGALKTSEIESDTESVSINRDTVISDGDITIDATKKIYLDGGGDTYIYEPGGDVLRIVIGGDVLLKLSELGDDGNEVSFGSSCVGFTQLEPAYDATSTTVDFRLSNKQHLTFGAGNITNLQVRFPLVSGNFTLLLKQDGTGSRTITNYKAQEFDETAADGAAAVKFPGGSNPTLTTAANHVDILSFYWDADNEIAYGVATLDFQD